MTKQKLNSGHIVVSGTPMGFSMPPGTEVEIDIYDADELAAMSAELSFDDDLIGEGEC